ncbi:MAG: VRR-NUC domain-containing protein [Pseudoalteromonas sp.]|uniref:VRR-NUC domain-containing protein n=1 Tax=Pseudoalteromonas sp. TaxID=53249 RepID=UPI001DA837D3|nr:VRR-NUC domain-containing protein [Pseudoalteromonas sp.]NRA77900.1 VRR-NUC domain-containing protein [Pseudoalteromonas sp.]
MTESAIQSKILAWLKANGFWIFKTISCNRSGIMDIVGCTPRGRFLGIEVKTKIGRVSPLQEWNIEEVHARNGIAFVARDLDTVKQMLVNEMADDTAPSSL